MSVTVVQSCTIGASSCADGTMDGSTVAGMASPKLPDSEAARSSSSNVSRNRLSTKVSAGVKTTCSSFSVFQKADR